MKGILSITLIAFLFHLPSFSHAQGNQKLGHVNITKLLETMPGYKTAEKKLQDFAMQLQETMGSMQDEYTKKVQDYYDQQEKGNMLPAIAEVKAKEIVDLENRIKKLETSSEQQLMEKQVELLTPLEEEVMKAIKDVADEKGYTYVFDSSVGGSLLYYPETDNITTLVKTKLGIQ